MSHWKWTDALEVSPHNLAKILNLLQAVLSAYSTGDGQQLSMAIQEARELIEKVRGG